MRKIWLALVVLALGATTRVHAQDSMLQKLFSRPTKSGNEVWATQYVQPDKPPQAVQAPTTVPPGSSNEQAQPAAEKIPEPQKPASADNAIVPAAPPKDLQTSTKQCAANCAAGHKHELLCACCERLKAWITYRQLHGCCGECASCCHIPPLYLYTVNDCVSVHHPQTLPCCAREMGPFRGLLLGEHPVQGSCKETSCSGTSCKAPVHPPVP